MSESGAIILPKLLLVEGKADVLFFRAFLRHLSVRNVCPEDFGGKDNLVNTLRALPKRSGFAQLSNLVIVRDADADSRAALQSVQSALQNAGLPNPERARTPAHGNPTVSVFILPDCDRRGMLETLCLESVNADRALPCVNEFFECVKDKASREPGNMDKARIHAWLSTQKRPDLRVGEAAEAGVWNFEHAAFAPLKEFLKSL